MGLMIQITVNMQVKVVNRYMRAALMSSLDAVCGAGYTGQTLRILLAYVIIDC